MAARSPSIPAAGQRTVTVSVESLRLAFILGTILIAILDDVLGAISHTFWTVQGQPTDGPEYLDPAAAARLITYGLNVAILMYVFFWKDKLIGQLFVFGLVAGLAELPSDWWSVTQIDALVYVKAGWFVWESPLYMPLAYVVVITQLGYLAYWLNNRMGLLKSTLLMGLIGGINVPAYEFLAKYAGYWYYQNVNMIFDAVPYYIIGGEVAFAAALPVMVSRFPRSGWPMILVYGLVLGVVMFVGWTGSYLVTG